MTKMSALTIKTVLERFFDRSQPENPLDMAQRSRSDSRAAGVKNYVIEKLTHDKFYILPPLIITVDASEIEFREFAEDHPDVGELWLPPDATFWCPDGQHKAYGSVLAYLNAPIIMLQEEIGVMLLLDEGSKRKQEIFLVINENAMKPNKSIMTLFDSSDEIAAVTRSVLTSVPIFIDRTALEATNITSRSGDFFTLNALRDGTKYLTKGYQGDREKLSVSYWASIAQNLPDWKKILTDKNPITVRDQSIAFHAITLNALGMVGARISAINWEDRLKNLKRINWSRQNQDWESLFMFDGKIRKTTSTTQAFATYILNILEDKA